MHQQTIPFIGCITSTQLYECSNVINSVNDYGTNTFWQYFFSTNHLKTHAICFIINKTYSNKRMASNNKWKFLTALKFFYTSNYSWWNYSNWVWLLCKVRRSFILLAIAYLPLKLREANPTRADGKVHLTSAEVLWNSHMYHCMSMVIGLKRIYINLYEILWM